MNFRIVSLLALISLSIILGRELRVTINRCRKFRDLLVQADQFHGKGRSDFQEEEMEDLVVLDCILDQWSRFVPNEF